MVKAVYMAGANKRFSLKNIYDGIKNAWIDFRYYGHLHIPTITGFKNLIPLTRELDGVVKPRPMFEYGLASLQACEFVDEVAVVGPKRQLMKSLENRLDRYEKARFIDQGKSFGENAKIGYEALGAKRHCLFMTSDSPTTRKPEVSEFYDVAKKYIDSHDLVYPMVPRSSLYMFDKVLRRPYFFMIPDTMDTPDGNSKLLRKGKKGIREGFRISSMIMADVEYVPARVIDTAYNLRKFMRPDTPRKLKALLGEDIVKNYFKKRILASDIETAVSKYFTEQVKLANENSPQEFRMKLVALRLPGSALDCDSRQDRKLFSSNVF